jgi:Lon protease-like protein
MSTYSFSTPFDELPSTLPLFPLASAIVMPGCHLPLTIFEPRYLSMVFDALRGNRLIGMVQPDRSQEEEEGVFATGTAGRIVSFSEMPEGRLLVVLGGISRFDIVEELESDRAYRQGRVEWSRFAGDHELSGSEMGFDRERMMGLLKLYFKRKGLQTDWSTFEEMPPNLLINALAGQLPLAATEKQVIVEAVTLEERISKFMHLLEFDAAGISLDVATRH